MHRAPDFMYSYRLIYYSFIKSYTRLFDRISFILSCICSFLHHARNFMYSCTTHSQSHIRYTFMYILFHHSFSHNLTHIDPLFLVISGNVSDWYSDVHSTLIHILDFIYVVFTRMPGELP